ncbi:hypothetical protein FJQ98_16405 [Lysinibacillus agricola]|uniref:Uncharacterized protein n=1 Tax=Lysinibacillus agricola TaxID=2590012 RepID=A0ABX7ALP7_9BACI|nr:MULTISPECIES: hypothetical protein [Lysinibacillus]KOS61485.1 hypothetical protein AN161_18005 [Lysinibacillus sp. FJAT-14222]QQP10827.1 hypothetical protein FJQ98_16405 [Lysinibacillus agricola]
MKQIMHQEILEFTYNTREERDMHVEAMEAQGWENGGKVRRLKNGVSIWDSDNKDNYEWFADFWKYY